MKKGTFRKIVAVGAGLTMLGATVFGATAAADLSGYPSPLFIQNGKFVGNIVVGADAKTDDVLGSIELAASLQTAAVKKVPIPGAGGQTASVDKENVKIRQSGREFTYNSTIKDVFGGSIDFSDLPTLLKSGTFKDSKGDNKEDQTYTQVLDFNDATAEYTFKQAEDVYDDAADSYLWFSDANGANAYVYTLDFDTAVTYANDTAANRAADLENNIIEIQGQKYTITDATFTAAGNVDKMELLAGETVVWMSQGEPLKRTVGGTEHTVILNDVNEQEDKCGISVDGTAMWIDKGDTETINGVQIGVTDAITVHSAAKDTDVCEVNVGASKITLQDGQEVKRDGTTIDGSNVEMRQDNTATAQRWDGFNITYVPADPVYLQAGKSFVDPVLQNFQFDFAGVNKVTEEIKWSRSGRNGKLEFQNIDGKPVQVDFRLTSATDTPASKVILGSDTNKRLLRNGDNLTCTATSCSAASVEGTQLFLVTSANQVHVLKITDVKDDTTATNDDKISFDDVTYNVPYDDKTFAVGNTPVSVDLGSLGIIQLTVNSTGYIKADSISFGTAYTKYKATIALQPTQVNQQVNAGFASGNFTVTEPTDVLEGKTAANNLVWKVNANMDVANNELDWGAAVPVSTTSWSSNALAKSDSDDNTDLAASEYGTIAQWDTENNKGGSMWVPEEQSFANAFVSKVGAVVSTGSGAEAVEFEQIQVGTAKKDTEITDVAAQNMIVVGGPCANSVAARLLGNPTECTKGFVEGEAMIKLFEQSNGNVALLVAGYSALDTRRATKVLANFRDPVFAAKLKGTEVKVKGTTLSDVTVESVATV